MSDSLDPLDVFREEARDLLHDFEQDLLSLDSGSGGKEQVDAAFRALHTIKGSGSMFDLVALTEYAHDLEAAFVVLRDSGATPSSRLVDLALQAADHLRRLVEGYDPSPEEQQAADRALAEIHGELGSTPEETAKVPPGADHDGDSEAGPRLVVVDYRPSPSTFVVGTNPLALLSELKEMGDTLICGFLDSAPPLDVFEPQDCYLRWEILLRTDQPVSAVEDVFMFVDPQTGLEVAETSPSAARSHFTPLISLAGVDPGELQKLVGQDELPADDEPASTAAPVAKIENHLPSTDAATEAASDTVAVASIKVRTDRLDRLVNLVGEMVSLQAQISLRSDQLGDRTMGAHAEQLERLVREARGLSMEMHMVPVDRLFAPFRRHVRSLAMELGREVTLRLSGTDTELDKNVVEQLRDPLLHIVRNAIDHGIESPKERAAAGKPEVGHVHLSAGYAGAMVRITVEDDGRGLDAALIRRRAIERGLIAADSVLSDDAVFELLFEPGFSTAATATAVSGRGVGMDVVRRNVEKLSGAVAIAGRAEGGTRVELRIPLTLAIVDGLLAEVGEQFFLIKLDYIRECLDGAAQQRGSVNDLLDFRGSVVPTVDLCDYFGFGRSRPQDPIVVVEAGDRRVGLVVSRLLGNHQSVVKSLGRLFSDVSGVSGAVFLSDGTPALMLDVERVVRVASRGSH